MGNEDEFRAKAAECFTLAGRTSYPDIAAQYVQLGSAYERLASWERRRAVFEDRLKAKLKKLGADSGMEERPAARRRAGVAPGRR